MYWQHFTSTVLFLELSIAWKWCIYLWNKQLFTLQMSVHIRWI